MNPQTRKLRVVVKAKELFNAKIDPKNQEEIIDDCTSIMDDSGFGVPFGDKNRNYLTTIFENYDVIWEIELDNNDQKKEGYSVALDSVNQDVNYGSKGFFSQNPISVEKGIVTGHVTGNATMEGEEEAYTINFHVNKNSESTPILPIDPKLRIKQ